MKNGNQSILHFSFSYFLQKRLKLLLECSLVSCTNKLVNQLTTLEEQDGRDVANAKLHSDVVVLLYITLTNGNSPFL